MEILKAEQAPEPIQAGHRPVDFKELAKKYNEAEINGVVKLGHRVSNITLFKRGIERRKIKHDVDFLAYNLDDCCYVKRLTHKAMEG